MKLKNENWEKELKCQEVDGQRGVVDQDFLNPKISQENFSDTSKTLNNETDFRIKGVK